METTFHFTSLLNRLSNDTEIWKNFSLFFLDYHMHIYSLPKIFVCFCECTAKMIVLGKKPAGYGVYEVLYTLLFLFFEP